MTELTQKTDKLTQQVDDLNNDKIKSNKKFNEIFKYLEENRAEINRLKKIIENKESTISSNEQAINSQKEEMIKSNIEKKI